MRYLHVIATQRALFRFSIILYLALCLSLTGKVYAGGNLTAEYERTIPKSAAEIWQLVGNFNGLHEWHPAVVKTDADGGGDMAGDRRLLTLGDGATIDEELLEYDQDGMRLSYKILEGPLPVSDYVSTISVSDSGDGSAKVVWNSTFKANGVSDDKAVEIITGIYVAGLDAVN
ncbi:MAG: SRPBCC family protein [Acidiferrobacterales bacterium]|nr:SRPBCC family protein [Acidiferrobacterales bacterium]